MSISKRLIIYLKLILPLLLILLFFLMPYIVMGRPCIQSVEPSVIVENSRLNDDGSITLCGKGFENIIAFYINGEWDPGVTIISETQEELKIDIPSKYFSHEGNIDLSFEIKLNTEMTAKSNAVKIKVLSDEIIAVPSITNVEPVQLNFDGNLLQTIKVYGNNINNDSVLVINDEIVDAKTDDGYICVCLPYSFWCDMRELRFQVRQKYNGYQTSIQSNMYNIKTQVDELWNDEPISNETIMLNYLSLLDNEDYIVVFSVKDESTQAVSEDVVNSLKKLGIKEDITSHGTHQSYIAILNGGENIYEEIGDECLCYKKEVDGVDIVVESANFNVGNYSKISIDGVDYSVNAIGLNIVVYDKTVKKVIDSVNFNTYEGLELIKY